MAVSADPTDPNFGLETDQSSPNFGLPSEPPKQEPSGLEKGLQTVQQGLGLAQKLYMGGIMGQYKLTQPAAVTEFEEKPLIPAENIKSLTGIALGKNFVNDIVGETLAGFTTPENLALLAVPGLVKGGIPTLRETALGEKPAAPEAMPQVPKPTISETVPPITPEATAPVQANLHGTIYVKENGVWRNTQSGNTVQNQFQHDALDNLSAKQEIQPEGVIQNAVQEQSPSSVLPHPQEGVTETGGERVGVGQGVQGEAPAETRPQTQEVAQPAGITVFRGEPKGPSTAGEAHGVGTYYGLTEDVAQRFSRKGTVKQDQVQLENPAIISSDAELRQIRESAGVNPDPRELLSKTEAVKFTNELQSRGNDGLVINYDEAPGGKQVVKFPPREPPPVPEAEGATTAEPVRHPVDEIYDSLLNKAASVGPNLYELSEKQITPAIRRKLNDRPDVFGRPRETDSFSLKPKSEVTGVPSDRGWILKDKKTDFIRRNTPPVAEPVLQSQSLSGGTESRRSTIAGEVASQNEREPSVSGETRKATMESNASTAQPLPKTEEVVPAEAVPEPVKTGVSSERFTEQYGEDAPVPNTGRSAGELKAIGQSRLDNFQKTGAVQDDPYSVLTNLREGKVPVSKLADDVSLLRAEHQRLKNDAINSEGTPEWEAKSQASLDMAQAIKEVAHGPASDMMRSFQEYDKPRYDNVTDFDQALRERLGRESTSQERVHFKKMADDVTNTRNGKEEAINGAQKRLSKMPKMNFEDAYKSIHDQIAELTKDCIL